jgi:adenosylcobinamide-GDP ribazoletransferase
MGAYQKRESRLSIMKDSHIGSFAVLAIVVVLLAKWVALNRLLSSGTILWLVPVLIISRGMMVELITTLPYARSGEGMARPFVEGASGRKRMWTHFISLCLCACFGPAGLALYGMGWLISRTFGIFFSRGFGGITGDLLGATNEMLEAILLTICALPGGLIVSYAHWGRLF